jgi:hypothetical protein
VLAEWLLTDKLVPYPHLGSRAAYNPLVSIEGVWLRWTFLIARGSTAWCSSSR